MGQELFVRRDVGSLFPENEIILDYHRLLLTIMIAEFSTDGGGGSQTFGRAVIVAVSLCFNEHVDRLAQVTGAYPLVLIDVRQLVYNNRQRGSRMAAGPR